MESNTLHVRKEILSRTARHLESGQNLMKMEEISRREDTSFRMALEPRNWRENKRRSLSSLMSSTDSNKDRDRGRVLLWEFLSRRMVVEWR